MKKRSKRLMWLASATLLIASLGSSGCGSKQRVEEREAAPPPTFDCISDRWAEPPLDVGQTPPDREPTALDIDPFLDATRQE